MMLSAAGSDRVDAPLRRRVGQQLPDLLGHERDHRVQQPQERVERVGQHPLGHRPRLPRRRSRALTIST